MDSLINNVINTWGDAGALWLDSLPETIEKLRAKWGLTDILAFPNLSYGFVAEANQNNKPVVLKITYDSINQENMILEHYNGHGMVSVLDKDSDVNALLLEKAIPGISLKNHPTPIILNKIAIYAEIVNKIASNPCDILLQSSATHVKDFLMNLTLDLIDEKISTKASSLAEYLLKTSKNEYLCHGDLHLGNILQNHDGWVAIDPKGIIAEKEFEVAAFDLLSDEELSNQVNLAKRIMSRNHSLATQFGFIPQRLLAWFFIRNILAAKWHVEDNGDPSKNIFIAEQIFSLLKTDD